MDGCSESLQGVYLSRETLADRTGMCVYHGQVQRIAIARALINQPKVLIMDEATSALDNRSQLAITETINALGITRISIAHRLATIQQADQIVILERGCPAESGHWDELKNHGYLQRMLASH